MVGRGNLTTEGKYEEWALLRGHQQQPPPPPTTSTAARHDDRVQCPPGTAPIPDGDNDVWHNGRPRQSDHGNGQASSRQVQVKVLTTALTRALSYRSQTHKSSKPKPTTRATTSLYRVSKAPSQKLISTSSASSRAMQPKPPPHSILNTSQPRTLRPAAEPTHSYRLNAFDTEEEEEIYPVDIQTQAEYRSRQRALPSRTLVDVGYVHQPTALRQSMNNNLSQNEVIIDIRQSLFDGELQIQPRASFITVCCILDSHWTASMMSQSCVKRHGLRELPCPPSGFNNGTQVGVLQPRSYVQIDASVRWLGGGFRCSQSWHVMVVPDYMFPTGVRLILGGKIIQILEDSGVPKEILSRVDIYKRQNQSQAMVSPSLSHHATDIGTESLNTRSQILGNFLLPPSNILCSAPPSVYSGFKSHPSSVVGLHCSTPGTTLSAKTSKNNLLADSNRPNATSSYLEEGYVDSRRQNFYTPTHRGQSITGDYVTGDIDSSKQTCALPDTSFRMTGTSSGSYSATIDPCLLQDRSHGYTSPNTGLGNLHMEAFNKTTPSPFATQSNPKLRVVSPEDRNTLGEVYRLEQNWQEASNLWVPGQASTTQAEAQLSLETLSNLPDNSDFGNFDSYTSDHFRNL